MSQNKEATENSKEATGYDKGQLLRSTKYITRRDVLQVVLEEGKRYTHKEVDSLITKFMKGKVK